MNDAVGQIETSGLALAIAPILREAAGGPEWDARMAAIALRVVRTELDARARSEPPVG